jgi:predicted deacylase
MNSKICHFAFEIAKKADYAITFHTLSHASVALPFSHISEVADSQINENMRLMAEAFGITCGRQEWSGQPWYAGFSAIAACHGLPTILVELQSQYVCSRAEVEVGIRGVLNVMKSLNMIDGEIEQQQAVPVIRKENLKWTNVEYQRGGFLRPIAELGEKVKQGQEIAIFVDALGSKVASVTSPANGYVMAYSASFAKPVVKEGGWLAIVFAEE